MNPAEIVVNVVKALAGAWDEYQRTRAMDEAASVAAFRSRVASEIAECLADETRMADSAAEREAELARVRDALGTVAAAYHADADAIPARAGDTMGVPLLPVE